MAESITDPKHKRLFDLNDPVVLLANFVELINQVWQTDTLAGLQFVAVNRSYEQVQYDQAVWLSVEKNHPKVEAMSNVALLDKRTALVTWIERMATMAMQRDTANTVSRLRVQNFDGEISKQWQEHGWGQALWVPMFYPEGELRGVLILQRQSPDFQKRDIALMERLATAYAQQSVLLTGGRKPSRKLLPSTRNIIIGLMVFAVAAMFIPVRQSALAPMEIRPKNPVVVSSPLNAAIDEIFVEPNTRVNTGQLLLKFNDTEIRSDFEHSEKSLAVTRERLRTAIQGSFQDEQTKVELRLIRAQLEKDKVVRDFKKKLFDYVELTAPTEGLLLYSGKNDWVGKPVSIGERIMMIADESQIEIEAQLAVSDDITIEPGAEVTVFLNSDPLKPIPAVLRTVSFTANQSAADIMAYKVIADLTEEANIPRIGSRGTAKIYGKTVPLGLYLFKKPLSSLRQTLGL
jgi:hypothetical protein